MPTEITSVPSNETTANVVTLPVRTEQASASEKAIDFVRQHPMLTAAGSLAVGLAISALIPRSVSRRFASRAFRLAEAGATAALAYGQDALDKAEDGGVIARKKAALFAGQAERLGEKAAARAEKLGVAAFDTAGALGHAAAERVGKLGHAAADGAGRLGHVAADRAEALGERASERLGKLGEKVRLRR